MAYYLSMDGVDDKIQTPSITFDEVIMDFSVDLKTATGQYYLDGRTGTTAYTYRETNNTDRYQGFTAVTVDAVTKPWGTAYIPSNQRVVYRLTGSPSATDNVNIFSNTSGIQLVKGKIYSVTFKNAGVVTAFYDMTLGNVQDQSGNGRNATLTGGTWVDDSAGTTHTGDVAVTGVSTVTASGTVSTGHLGQASGIGVASVVASGSVLGPAQTGDAAVVGVSSVVATGSVKLNGNVAIVGVSTVIASAAGMPIKGDASVFGVSWVTASALSGIVTLKRIRFLGERQTKINFMGLRTLTIRLQGERQTVIWLQGGLQVAKSEQNAPFTAGDSTDIVIDVTDSDGTTPNLTGASAVWALKQSVIGPASVSKSGSVSGAKVTFTLNPSDTLGLKAGRYYHEAQVTDSMGKVSTVTKGWITIESNGV